MRGPGEAAAERWDDWKYLGFPKTFACPQALIRLGIAEKAGRLLMENTGNFDKNC